VTRIVAGQAKGRRLAVPSRGTRPTSERAREALFNSLGGLVELDGLRVLDLFAGSGAVGLEALSRGASAVTLVESDRAACVVLRRNVAAVGLPGAEVRQRTAASYLASGPDERYGLVFADPPYAFSDDAVAALLDVLAGPGWLAERAVLVLERPARGPVLRWPDGVEQITQRRYGEGVLWYGRRR
jgi:16S rRNA (guanine966-N2)-methyltransferase